MDTEESITIEDASPVWNFIPSHRELQSRMDYPGEDSGEGGGIETTPLRCIRMMGTFIGAATGSSSGGRPSGNREQRGLIDQIAEHISQNWEHLQSVFLVGSHNEAIPLDQPPYMFYTYAFVAGITNRLVDQGHHAKAMSDQLTFRFTFVPEDILFAQFFFDEQHLITAASYGWDADDTNFAYAALYLENDGRYDATSRRLIEIFDARFRTQAGVVGEETWTIRRDDSSKNGYAVCVSTPFWSPSDSLLEPFDFGFRETPSRIEMGQNMLRQFETYMNGLVTRAPG